MVQVLHTMQDSQRPIKNRSIVSTAQYLQGL